MTQPPHSDTAAATLERVLAVHARYFDLDGTPGFDDTNPEPEDVWRYDRDFRAALATNPAAEAAASGDSSLGQPLGKRIHALADDADVVAKVDRQTGLGATRIRTLIRALAATQSSTW